MKKMHRWQPTGHTPCGEKVDDVKTNLGYYLMDGVTCNRCKKGSMLWSILNDRWHGESDGFPQATTPPVECA